MDTLAPPPAVAATPANPSAPADLLRARSRRRRLGGPLLWINAGLLLTLAFLWKLHPTWLPVTAWHPPSLVWAIGTGVTLLGALLFWVYGRRSAPLQGARSLDENLRAMNRLEAAALLESHADPIARAQRAETAAFLADHGPRRRGTDYLNILSWTVAALVFAHLATLTVWTRPWQRPAAAPIKATPTPPPAAPPKATITWKTPKSEIKASPVEEVPLEAVADSATGLRDLVLEASVNGTSRLSTPIPNEALAKAGSHPIPASLYLDQLNVEPYDMVSYFLHAKRIARGDLPDVVSPVQFVEVKPFRDDVRELPGGDGTALFGMLTALKVAQLNLLKQNFVLGHAEIGRENVAWKKENTRVGDEQATLGAKADEVIAKFIQEGLPAEIVDLLQQSRTLMGESAEKIRAVKNMDALPVQGKSLGLITEIEKFFVKIATKDGSGKRPKQVKDPFEKPKDFEMKQRFDTVAGGLEALAQAQLKLAQELARADPKDPEAGKPTPAPPGAEPKKPDPNRIEGTFGERQTLIAQRIGALLNQQVLPPEVNTHLEAGQGHARDSLRQLDADDIVQAREPAAATARELRLAIQAMDRLGEDNTNDKLADALNRLNKAAEEAREAGDVKSETDARQAADAAAEKAADARDQLAEAARQQQETGSAQAAARLAEAVRALDDQKLRDALKQWHDQPRSGALASAAAEQLARAADRVAEQRGGKASPEDIVKLVERVERTRRNLERLAAADAGAPPGPASPASENPVGQRSGEASSPVVTPNNEHPAGNQPGKDAAGQPKGEGQPTGESNQPPQNGAPGKDAQAKAASGKDGKGKNEKGPGQQGKGNNLGKGSEGQGQGPAKSDKGQGKGQGKSDKAEGQGQNPGQGQRDGQGGESQPTRAPGMPGQPSGGQPGQSTPPDGAAGRGHGGRSSAADPASDGNAEAPMSSASPAGDHPKSPSAGGGGSQGDNLRSANGLSDSPRTERQAQELMADLRDETLEARVILVSPDSRQVLEDLHPDIHSPRPRNNIAIVASYERIRAPLDRLITLLRAEIDRSQRQHELTDQTQEKAPLAYGDAVADYFEQLSHDYRPSSTPAPATPDPGATPAP